MARHDIRVKLRGCSFKGRPDALLWFRANRPNVPAWLEREPSCPFDRNAVRVMAMGANPVCIGYLSLQHASEIAPLLDAGQTIPVTALTVTGGRNGKPVGCLADLSWQD